LCYIFIFNVIDKSFLHSVLYDKSFRFVPSKFEEIFNKHAHTHPNALTYDELTEMIKANREPKDFSGR